MDEKEIKLIQVLKFLKTKEQKAEIINTHIKRYGLSDEALKEVKKIMKESGMI